MSALPLVDLDATTLARLGIVHGTDAMLPSRAVLALDWPELEQALPDRGLPRGVIELAAMPRIMSSAWGARRPPNPSSRHQHPFESMRGGATTIAIAAIRAVHASDEHAWCAWVAPSCLGGTPPPKPLGGTTPNLMKTPSLYAPALAQAGVDLDRLLIVRPSIHALSRTVVKTASSGAFGLVVVDVPRTAMKEGPLVTRKLALAAEEYGTTSLLLTSAIAPRPVPWPVAMRLEVERRPESIALRVVKDRRGVASSQHIVRLSDLRELVPRESRGLAS